MAKHQESWGSFPSEFEDAPALVTTDLGWGDEGPDPRRGMLIRVRVPVPEPDENDGLGPFLELIEPFDEALNAELPKRLNAVAVGMLISSAYRYWCFYASRADGVQDLVARAAARCKGLTPEVLIEDDPEWEFYEEVLFPDDLQQRYMADEAVIMQLQENGDDADIPRPIEHVAVFPDPESRDRFVQWCGQNGFMVTDAGGEPEDEDDGYPVEFTHTGTTNLDDIFEKTSLASEGAEQFDGEYDGWGTSIMKS